MSRRVMVMGVGAFAHSVMTILQESGADTDCYLTRPYAHYGANKSGRCWDSREHPSPLPLIADSKPDLIVPMAIAWAEKPWAERLVSDGAPLLSPVGKAMQIEVSRETAAKLCRKHGVPVPEFHYAGNRLEALEWMREQPRPYVLKNPICSPFSPVHTIVCETVQDTLGWLDRVDYAEGVFLQEYLGTAEAGHFVFVSGGEITSLVTNQEYKRAFTGNMGPVAGAPMAGIAEQDPEDRYGLAAALIHPLKPWFKETRYRGPLQVTAIQKGGTWHAIEYNVRLGVTTAALLLRMLENPLDALIDVVRDRVPRLRWHPGRRFGCTLSLAGQGYPYVVPSVPKLPVDLKTPLDCDLWWNEVDETEGQLSMASHRNLDMGHRICDVNACAPALETATSTVYDNIRRVRCLGSYYRLDLGETLWPPGTGF